MENQLRRYWRADKDGDELAFRTFVEENFAAEPARRDALFERMEFVLESINGHMTEIWRDVRRQADLDLGAVYPFDEILAAYQPGAHVNDDLFDNKLAFMVLLNFPIRTLEEKLRDGPNWSRREWAEARLAQYFSKRIPASVSLANARAVAKANQYIATYNIWMHHLVGENGERPFPPKMRLLSHWNLRDEIRAQYGEGSAGLAKQRIVARVMERIIDQSIPNEVVDNPALDWNPFTNAVTPARAHDADHIPSAKISEANSRYGVIMDVFRAVRLVDPYSPTAPTLMERRFNEEREIPESRVREMLEAVLTSPLVPRLARTIEQRLGRPLEPFDIWYNGFRSRGRYTESQLDDIVRKKYPHAEAYKADIPRMLRQLGFSAERAELLARNIEVDPARGSGHAWGPAHRKDRAHLRTRVAKEGIDYKGYNIAVHEMGHNVEQIFSLHLIDHTLLAGVPNTAFTEALAFVFQNRDLELLGLAPPTEEAKALQALNDFWGTYEIAGVALVDMAMWHWLYDHPQSNPAELNNAVEEIAREIWNRDYAAVFHRRDVTLLAIYSHIVDSVLYMPDYPLGHFIAAQIEQQMGKANDIGGEFERMARMGCVTPDVWMRNATAAPVGPEALLDAAERALTYISDP